MKFTPLRFVLLCAVLVCCASSLSHAWATKEHIQLTRLAAERLIADPATPPAMRDWLKAIAPDLMDMAGEKEYLLKKRVGATPRGVDGVAFWACMPDVLAASELPDRKTAPFGVHEKLLHYIDLEMFVADESKRTYADDLSHRPALADVPRDMKDPRYQKAGMLPFRVEDCYRRLVTDLRAGKLNEALGQFPRDEHAGKWAGFLAHYAGDSTMPMHATIDYKAASYFGGAARSPNIHADMEYRLVDDDNDDYMKLREEYWTLLARELAEGKDPAAATTDPWKDTVQTCIISYGALPMIGHAGQAAYPAGDSKRFDSDAFFHYKGRYLDREMTVLEMKAAQQAWAVRRIAGLWRQAWDEAAKAGPAASSPAVEDARP